MTESARIDQRTYLVLTLLTTLAASFIRGVSTLLESVFGRARTVSGAAMLVGSVAGGIVAQITDLGVPYLLRAAMLGVTLLVALRFMRDIGFSPKRGASPVAEVRSVVNGASRPSNGRRCPRSIH